MLFYFNMSNKNNKNKNANMCFPNTMGIINIICVTLYSKHTISVFGTSNILTHHISVAMTTINTMTINSIQFYFSCTELQSQQQ